MGCSVQGVGKKITLRKYGMRREKVKVEAKAKVKIKARFKAKVEVQ